MRKNSSRFAPLHEGTREPHAVRVCGQLDTISVTSSCVLLALSDGPKISVRLQDHDTTTLQRLFGTQVAVSGMARYRPSGKLLRIDADTLVAAREADVVFCTLPQAPSDSPLAPVVTQDRESGVSAFLGIWPGDESEEDLLRSLRQMG